MLQSIRDRTQGWIAGIIISLLIFSFALWGVHSYFFGAGDNAVVAKVNGVEINKSQLSVTYERLRRQLQIQSNTNNDLSEQADLNLKQRALQTLINIQVLKQASVQNDYRITTRQTENFLQNMPEFQVNGEFSLTRFQQALSTTLFNAMDFLELIKTSLLIDQPRLGIIYSSDALPNEITAEAKLIGQERTIQYLSIPATYFANSPVTISSQQLNTYYEQHQEEFKTPEQVSVDYVMLSLKDIASKIHPSDQALKNFYNENINLFTTSAQWQLQELILPVSPKSTPQQLQEAVAKMDEIIALAEKGTDFATLQTKYSLQKGDAKLAGWNTITQLPVDIQKTVVNLTKVGMVSPKILVDQGIILVKVIGYQAPQTRSFDSVKDQVKENYSLQHAEEQYSEQKEKLANLTYEHPDTLKFAAEQLDLPIQSTEMFTREKGGKDLTANLKVRQAAFSNDALSLQNNSDVIQLTPDSVVVLRVKSHIPAALLSLKAVEKNITGKLQAVELEKKVLALAREIKTKLSSGVITFDQAASQYHLTWINVGTIGRHSTKKVDQAILDAAFEMPQPSNGKTYSFAMTKNSNGFVVIALSAIREGNSNISKEEYQAYAEQIQNSFGLLEYELYKDAQISHAKISIVK